MPRRRIRNREGHRDQSDQPFAVEAIAVQAGARQSFRDNSEGMK
jgi:hypothetical protein